MYDGSSLTGHYLTCELHFPKSVSSLAVISTTCPGWELATISPLTSNEHPILRSLALQQIIEEHSKPLIAVFIKWDQEYIYTLDGMHTLEIPLPLWWLASYRELSHHWDQWRQCLSASSLPLSSPIKKTLRQQSLRCACALSTVCFSQHIIMIPNHIISEGPKFIILYPETFAAMCRLTRTVTSPLISSGVELAMSLTGTREDRVLQKYAPTLSHKHPVILCSTSIS